MALSAATAWVGSEFLPSSLFSFRKGIFSSAQWEVPIMALKRVSKHLLYLLNENNLFFFSEKDVKDEARA